MSKFKSVGKVFAGGLLGALLMNGGQKVPKLPEPKIPAPPAPGVVSDSGAVVSIGTTDVKNNRVSGRAAGGKSRASGDFLGGLGRGGLSI